MVKEAPDWLKKFMTEEEIKRIEEAVKSAELQTVGEIVPYVVHRSIPTGQTPLIGALIGFIIGMLTLDFFAFPSAWISALYECTLALIGYGLGRLEVISLRLFSQKDIHDAVFKRALLAFHDAKITKTEGQTGVLLFVSLFEHKAYVLFDDGIAKHCDEKTFAKVADLLVKGAKERKLANGFIAAIQECVPLLQTHFPATQNKVANPNELHDYLRIYDS